MQFPPHTLCTTQPLECSQREGERTSMTWQKSISARGRGASEGGGEAHVRRTFSSEGPINRTDSFL